jgi:hypothetical protein
MNGKTLGGAAAIALGIGFNIPYAALAALYDYPQVLRRPAAEALRAFAQGGAPLILAWYAFMIAALALVPVAAALSITAARLARTPALALGAALAGALAGTVQAIGLSRWVFVVPALAQNAESSAAQASFDLLNAYGGVAVGEHLGQLLTALFALQIAMLQQREGAPRLAGLGFLTAGAIAAGTGEGIALALGNDGALFSLATIAGFLGLSVWLVATGTASIRSPQASRTGHVPAAA